MGDDMVSRLPNRDMQGAPAALLRAARRAREIARQTGTGIIVMRAGEVVEVPVPDEESDVPESDVIHDR